MKKQWSTPNVRVGTVKKSIAAIASRWLLRNVDHRFAGTGFLGALRIQRRTVLSERSKPSIFNSPWMRGAPQVLFSVTLRKMSSRSSLLTHLLPTQVRCREIHFQYRLNPARCQRTTVSGCTTMSARCHLDQRRHKVVQNSLSEVEKRGRGRRSFKTASCCRRARFSKSRSRREQKDRAANMKKSLSRHSMKASLTRKDKRNRLHVHLTDYAADRNFGEAQVAWRRAGWSRRRLDRK